MNLKTEILFEDHQILVVGKPAGMPTQTADILQTDVVSELKRYLNKEGNAKEPYLGIIHRLDQPVSGVLVFAKTPAAAASLTKQLTEHTMQKEYLAAVYYPERYMADTTKKEGTKIFLTDYLKKDKKTNTSRVVSKETPHAKKAELTYEVLKTTGYEAASAALLKVILKTGRHHQIRVQLSHAGMPLLGDQKYGTEESQRLSEMLLVRTVALCAEKLTFIHPQSKESMTFEYCEHGVTIWNS